MLEVVDGLFFCCCCDVVVVVVLKVVVVVVLLYVMSRFFCFWLCGEDLGSICFQMS